MPKSKSTDLDTREEEISSSGEVIVPNRVVLVNPLSKGNLGKTTFYEYLVTCLEESGIRWQGANMDNRHLAFQESHTTEVKNFFDEDAQSLDEYHPLFSAVRRSTASMYLIDQRAQADLAFLYSAKETGFLKSCLEHNVRIVPICVAIDDLNYMQNLNLTVSAFAKEGIFQWLVLSNPSLHGNSMFMRSGLMSSLRETHAAVFDIPWLSQITMARYAGLNASMGGPYSFAKAILHPRFQKEDMCVFELQSKISNMAKQFRVHAKALLPDHVSFSEMVDLNNAGWSSSGIGGSETLDQSVCIRDSMSATFFGET